MQPPKPQPVQNPGNASTPSKRKAENGALSPTSRTHSGCTPHLISDLWNPPDPPPRENLQPRLIRRQVHALAVRKEAVQETPGVRVARPDDAHGGPALGAHGPLHRPPAVRVPVLKDLVDSGLAAVEVRGELHVLLGHDEGVRGDAAAAPLAAGAVAGEG